VKEVENVFEGVYKFGNFQGVSKFPESRITRIQMRTEFFSAFLRSSIVSREGVWGNKAFSTYYLHFPHFIIDYFS
jgi:hypothetical protein